MTVNFKTPEGLEIVQKLVAQADVLVENFVSGKLATMGLGYHDCKKINERLIYASITGKCCSIDWVASDRRPRLWTDWALQKCCRV